MLTRTVLCVAFVIALPLIMEHATWADDKPAPPSQAKRAYEGLVFLGTNPKGAEEWLRVIDGATVIRVTGGAYQARPYEATGTTERPEPVQVAACFLDKHEVTNARFARFLSAMSTIFHGYDIERRLARWLGRRPQDGVPGDLLRRRGRTPEWVAAVGRGQHPVVEATGFGAVAYAYWADGRIPTEREWEKAAGGTRGSIYPWGSEAPDAQRANFGRPRPVGTAPVGSRPAGAGPYGHLDMAGNVYDRVMHGSGGPEVLPTMLKGGSWLSPHPLNLRVLDMCVQPMEVAEGSVGFRLAMDDRQPDRPAVKRAAPATLRVAKDFADALEEAEKRGVPVFLSLQYDTCGQCDRIRAQLFRDPRFIAYCNTHLVVIVGHQSGDALNHPHPENDDGTCPLYPGLECYEHHTNFRQALRVVGGFVVSPGNFVLDPYAVRPGAGEAAILIGEREFPKWGGGLATYLAAFERARRSVAARKRRRDEGKEPRIEPK